VGFLQRLEHKLMAPHVLAEEAMTAFRGNQRDALEG
jgi:hypothetical protein